MCQQLKYWLLIFGNSSDEEGNETKKETKKDTERIETKEIGTPSSLAVESL